jgi:hypothetical protein
MRAQRIFTGLVVAGIALADLAVAMVFAAGSATGSLAVAAKCWPFLLAGLIASTIGVVGSLVLRNAGKP